MHIRNVKNIFIIAFIFLLYAISSTHAMQSEEANQTKRAKSQGYDSDFISDGELFYARAFNDKQLGKPPCLVNQTQKRMNIL